MPVIGTSVDYSTRLVDIYVSGALNFTTNSAQFVKYGFGYPTRYIAGVQKLAQRYLISLANSGLFEELQGYSNSNIIHAKNLFNEYNMQIITKFRGYQNSQSRNTVPLDEMLDTVVLTSVTSSGNAISFSARLTTKAGDNVTVLLPLPLL